MPACSRSRWLSIAIRFPFTLQYAREVVDAETAVLPGFIKANYIITWAWAAAFAADDGRPTF